MISPLLIAAPPESQLILLEGDPPPVFLKSEKDAIDIFFCPDPSSGNGGLHPAAPDSSEDEAPSTSLVNPVTSSTRRSTSSKKRSSFGSAQRNLSKAFDDVPFKNGSSPANVRNNLFNAFNASVERESKSILDDDDEDGEEEEEDEDPSTEEEPFIPKPFRTSSIGAQKDLLLLNEAGAAGTSEESDVKLALFSPQKSQCGSAQKWEIPDIGSFSPSFLLGASDDRFFPLEPDADYNFSLADTEGIADLFDYKI